MKFAELKIYISKKDANEAHLWTSHVKDATWIQRMILELL